MITSQQLSIPRTKLNLGKLNLDILDCVIIRPNDQVHLSSEVTDSLESDHLCVISCFDVSVARSCPVYRYVRNIRGIDRSAFVADLELVLAIPFRLISIM